MNVSAALLALAAVGAADDCPLCGTWEVLHMKRVYPAGAVLRIDPDLLQWPGCAPAPYTLEPASDGSMRLTLRAAACPSLAGGAMEAQLTLAIEHAELVAIVRDGAGVEQNRARFNPVPEEQDPCTEEGAAASLACMERALVDAESDLTANLARLRTVLAREGAIDGIDPKVLAGNIDAAQRAWRVFRDAHCMVDADLRGGGPQWNEAYAAECRLDFTQHRSEEIAQWLCLAGEQDDCVPMDADESLR